MHLSLLMFKLQWFSTFGVVSVILFILVKLSSRQNEALYPREEHFVKIIIAYLITLSSLLFLQSALI